MVPVANVGATSATYNDVTRGNIEELSGPIRQQISSARFIAIDTEFTGLSISNASSVFRFNTSEWVTRATDMNEKYRAMANVAKTHALVSMGISTYSYEKAPSSYNVHNFNFTLQQQNSHLINANSIGFLAETGFDLNKQAREGIRYFAAPNPKPVEVKTLAINKEGGLIREIFLDIIRARKPLVIHNGLFDLMYVYQAFFGPLPESYESFVYDLCEMFPGGIYDTKHIVEMESPGAASFLAYAFHKSERVQDMQKVRGEDAVCAHLKDRFPLCEPEHAADIGVLPIVEGRKPYCEQFAAHGHCRYKEHCLNSHDINFILDCQSKSKAEPKQSSDNSADSVTVTEKSSGVKRKATSDPGEPDKHPSKVTKVEAAATTLVDSSVSVKSPSTKASSDLQSTMYHTAAYDAFMTGYIFASYRNLLQKKVSKYRNKVYLMGRPGQPLLIKAGIYATSSITYRQTVSLFEKPAAAPALAPGSDTTDGTHTEAATEEAESDCGADKKNNEGDGLYKTQTRPAEI
ncbi:CAF1 family ribonuclease-domain-containing protein [Kickxella alabastrina]|uniref:CAF1 family ribonuclease-domain-containing protein n=1 Tax=Kickxella alabastrina TaxID=61397 RepID=UPI00221E3FAF|nr:CAF1 family ribonuclease-domain-containing protein [Kickxella alabastrina]KAI7834714.1 CAF1 family ribonuclease-domain-containing protein [Kickxella alabastrina]